MKFKFYKHGMGIDFNFKSKLKMLSSMKTNENGYGPRGLS